ncbi:MAG: electron transport complex subunit RsxE, partial [bacterium]
MNIKTTFLKGLYEENPVFRLVLGMCPTLAVTTTVFNSLGMGAATFFVLLCSNILVSSLRNIIPAKIRIPVFIIVIASFTTIADLAMQAFVPPLHKALGIFIPLIVVNCIILGRAEAFASKNSILNSIVDALGMGI